MKKEHTVTIGENRGAPRIWIQAKSWLADAGFSRGIHFNADIDNTGVTITVNANGTRTVSGKADGTCIIDMNTVELAKVGPVGTVLNIAVKRGRLTLTPVTGVK